MTPLEIVAYAAASGVALIVFSIFAGIAYMIWHTAVQKTHDK